MLVCCGWWWWCEDDRLCLWHWSLTQVTHVMSLMSQHQYVTDPHHTSTYHMNHHSQPLHWILTDEQTTQHHWLSSTQGKQETESVWCYQIVDYEACHHVSLSLVPVSLHSILINTQQNDITLWILSVCTASSVCWTWKIFFISQPKIFDIYN